VCKYKPAEIIGFSELSNGDTDIELEPDTLILADLDIELGNSPRLLREDTLRA
jgi:hypothetical protein